MDQYYFLQQIDTRSFHQLISRWSAAVLFSLLMSLSVYAQTIRYVSTSGSNPDPSSAITWATSTTNLQSAINASAPGDQVWVAAGTYIPGGNRSTDRTVSFSLKNGVAVYGGFVGNENNLADRPDVNPVTTHLSSSTLSGYLTGGTNATAVVANRGISNTAELDGFVIVGGNNTTSRGGGGMYNENSSPQLRNLMFNRNDASKNGAGMYNMASNPSLANCFFNDNYSVENGAGMYNTASSPSLSNCLFKENYVDTNGGGMYNTASSPSLTNCTFEMNYSGAFNLNYQEGGAGMYNISNSNPILINCSFRSNETSLRGSGGGIFNYASSPRLTDCTFQENLANGAGGGIYNTNKSNPTLTNCAFQANLASQGGGIANEAGLNGDQSSNLVLINCSFIANVSVDFGGGMHTLSSSPSLINCTFQNNKTKGGGDPILDFGGGGLFIGGSGNPKLTNCTFQNNSSGYGGGVSIVGTGTGNPILTGCTFQSNSATSGGGIYCEGTYASTRLTNCIVQSNSATSGAGIYNLISSPSLTNCSLQGNSAMSGGGLYNTGGGSLNQRHPYSGFSKPTLTNCSFQSNIATSGRGIYNTNASEVTLNNCVLFGNGGTNTIVNGVNSTSGIAVSKVSASYCLFESGETDYTGSNNLNTTITPFASTTRTQLAIGSSAINAGNNAAYASANGPTTDLAGNLRIQGGSIDMGAYEIRIPPDLVQILNTTLSTIYG